MRRAAALLWLLLAAVPGPARAAGPCVLLVERHLEVEGQAATAVLDGPADARPAARGELTLPRHPVLDERVLVARATPVGQVGELAAEVFVHPRAHRGAESGLVGPVRTGRRAGGHAGVGGGRHGSNVPRT